MPTQPLPETIFSAAFTGVLSADYLRTDVPISGSQNLRQNIRYGDLKTLFTNGDGDYKANLLWETRETIGANTSKVFDLNGGLLNRWDQPLNFNAIKLLVIRNRSAIEGGTTIFVNFKNEAYAIGPQGSRVIIEPISFGINVFRTLNVSSSSSEEGGLVVNTIEAACEIDIIIIGSRYEESSSSGL